jgi:hypothetical protein
VPDVATDFDSTPPPLEANAEPVGVCITSRLPDGETGPSGTDGFSPSAAKSTGAPPLGVNARPADGCITSRPPCGEAGPPDVDREPPDVASDLDSTVPALQDRTGGTPGGWNSGDQTSERRDFSSSSSHRDRPPLTIAGRPGSLSLPSPPVGDRCDSIGLLSVASCPWQRRGSGVWRRTRAFSRGHYALLGVTDWSNKATIV